MSKKTTILILLLFVGFVFCDTGSARERLLRDGFALMGIDGKLSSEDGSDRWFFEFDSGVSDGTEVIEAGVIVGLLPSATLENMIVNVGKRSESGYRLWGTVTKYRGKNFIFPIYFLPISDVKRLSSQSQQKGKPAINEPNDALVIPEDIIAKLAVKKVIRTEQLEKGLELKQNSILADRTAVFVEQVDGGVSLVLDGIGRGIQKISFPLLPCEVLEYTQQKQASELEQVHFKVAGIVTRYKGEHYLLLQRARRVYSHGNFR
ncbi:MAG: hypothetical protein KAS75_06585 [Planctomycetes bacterium]|nr:hypothetical protein [Planctomycetota bacterium]